MSHTSVIRFLVLSAFAVFAAMPVSAVPPFAPTEFDLKEVLLDPGGAALVGPVDLEYRVWDAAAGGNLLYKQVLGGVPLDAQGRMDVRIGPFGAPTSDPDAPLTPVLLVAVGADVGLPQISGNRYFEITVLGESGPRPRVRFVSVAFALRSLESGFAITAERALDVRTPGGVDAAILDSMWLHLNPDGGPPNTDPSEGLQDTDGDGVPNWADSDNDGDGISDTSEPGPGINLPTPRITGTSKSPSSLIPDLVIATGLAFLPGLTATVDGGAVAVTGVSENSFTFQTNPLPEGNYLLTATNLNGEFGSRTLSFGPTVLSTIPGTGVFATARRPVSLRALGADRFLGGVGSFGSRDGVIDGQLMGGDTFSTGGNGLSTLLTWDDSGRVRGVRGQIGSLETRLEVGEDTDDNGNLTLSEWTPVEVFAPSLAVADGLAISVEGTGRLAIGAVRASVPAGPLEAVVYSDRDGNGDFAGPGEFAVIESRSGSAETRAALEIDPAGGVAYVSHDLGTSTLRLAWDRNNDGDFNDTVGTTPEVSTVVNAVVECVGMDFDPSGTLVMVVGTLTGTTLYRDLDGNGEVTDTGEATPLDTGSAKFGGCDVDANGPLAVMTQLPNFRLRVDRNEDGDFDDVSEFLDFGVSSLSGGAISRLSTGQVVFFSSEGIVLDPVGP